MVTWATRDLAMHEQHGDVLHAAQGCEHLRVAGVGEAGETESFLIDWRGNDSGHRAGERESDRGFDILGRSASRRRAHPAQRNLVRVGIVKIEQTNAAGMPGSLRPRRK